MGLVLSKSKEFKEPRTIQKRYSWEQRNSLSIGNYIIQKLNNTEEYKYPGTVNGEQLVIQFCSNSSIYILDWSSSITIDDCENCKIIMGPVKGSIFVRDCIDCVIIGACEQFRARDCDTITISLYCSTQPVIESSININFTCYQLHYCGLEDHFFKSKLNVWNNTWYNIYDYTPSVSNTANWGYESNSIYSMMLSANSNSDRIVKYEKIKSVVPFTNGQLTKIDNSDFNCLVAFNDGVTAKNFVNALENTELGVCLVRTRQLMLVPRLAELLFLTAKFIKAVQNELIIGLHVLGREDVLSVCKRVAEQTAIDKLYYVSPTANIASHQVNTFFEFPDE